MINEINEIENKDMTTEEVDEYLAQANKDFSKFMKSGIEHNYLLNKLEKETEQEWIFRLMQASFMGGCMRERNSKN